MAVQAQTVEVARRASGLGWKELLSTFLIFLLGAMFLALGGVSTGADDLSVFTDRTLGTLLALPSQATLYTIGAICFFIGGLRLFRRLSSWRSTLNWAVVLLSGLAFLVWITSGTSMNLPGMIQATLVAATPLTLGAMAGIFCERSGIINILKA